MAARFLILCSLGAGLALASCHRPPRSSGDFSKSKEGKIVEATWYNVPADSLARRRAGLAELTAASDRLKLGTLVRVTRVSNRKQVVVRITDTGLHSKKSGIDVCKEAAEQLDMVSEGIAKVRLEVLSSEGKTVARGGPSP